MLHLATLLLWDHRHILVRYSCPQDKFQVYEGIAKGFEAVNNGEAIFMETRYILEYNRRKLYTDK